MENLYRAENLKDFLTGLMDNKIVEAVIVPLKCLENNSFSPFLIKNIDLLENCEPFAPVMSINSARAVSHLTLKGALPYKTAVVLRPCELLAFRELVKLNQINPENIITISYDCNGINSLKNIDLKRETCEICKNFTPEYADIKIYSFGLEKKIIATEFDLDKLKLEKLSINLEKRDKYISEKMEKQLQNRKKALENVRENLKDILRNCIVCKNCMRVCPICFCQECFFDSPALKGNSVTYSLRGNRLKGVDFPENKLLFHLGRMNHMSVSCIGCGACSDACPAEIPVMEIFSAAGDELKKLFNYEPGRDLAEKVPFTCYEHDELHSFEKPYI